ncbi:PhoU-like phosphate uptake regulator [Hydrogenispora ethanolica]|jgi:phosphate transport system protein|uniref:Phosphate-specific transport system accessory protein PhoU n=1 Tax=Hydrogenispora ethanolica TaxID=1082276 RepID=A0A4V2QFT7_HYDET|nr:phosphate signaling complex protein PhoU [Hydrogenispora ethanolica]TCL73217.1 PhoU-like phosphate uptake regulator [Hydrogenispora ethanolica]
MITTGNNLEQVQRDLLKMGSLVEETMKMAIQALREQDAELARNVIERDDAVDNLQIVIEEEIERAVSAAPPLGFDLKRDFAMIKIVNDLERIGDYATNIAEVVLELKQQHYLKPLVHIPQLAAVSMNMVSTVLKAFVEKDIDLAEAVCKKDEEADNLYDEICDELVRLTGQDMNPQQAYQISRFLLIAEWLERAADHATNIGEETIYILTGKRVKY